MGFYRVLALIIELLQHEGRVTYQGLKREFGFDEAFLEDVRAELFFRGVARDEQGKGLVWTGARSVPVQSTGALEPASSARGAERRQVTVMFCDLVDSTQLSQQLDAEDYRAVVRAYQEAAVTAMQPWDGYVAQYLGDGLMVYFGWPRAHEDAVHHTTEYRCRCALGCIPAWRSSGKWAAASGTNSWPWGIRPISRRACRDWRHPIPWRLVR
jgi:hypothetical protein